MSQQIQIPDELYDRLAAHAIGFDTPADVIERLLDNAKTAGNQSPPASRPNPTNRNHKTEWRDFSKYSFNGQLYGKGRLALAVISAYVSENDGMTQHDLAKVFPNHLQGSHGVFCGLDEALRLYDQERRKRYFIKNEEIVELADGLIAVCNQWGRANIDSLIEAARELGYEIEKSE